MASLENWRLARGGWVRRGWVRRFCATEQSLATTWLGCLVTVGACKDLPRDLGRLVGAVPTDRPSSRPSMLILRIIYLVTQVVRRRVSRPRWVGGRTKRLPQGQGPRRQTNPTLGSGGGSFKMTRRYKTFGKSKEGKHDLAGQRPKNFRPAGAAWRGGPGPRPRPRPTDRLGRDPGTGNLGRDLTGINVLTRRSPAPETLRDQP